MARDVGPEQSTLDTVLAAVDTMLLAIEIPNSRFVEFTKAGQPQICADAGYSARFVQGKEISDWAELDLPAQPVTLFINNTEIARGNGAAVLGDPRIALRWIANELPKYGRQLRAGDIISTGTATKAPPIKAGDYVRADFGELGIVETTFAG
jgi:2-keto-4-pentenoate hydratase